MSDPMWPSWGGLVHAPAEEVRGHLGCLRHKYYFPELVFRASGDWTGVFYPEADSANEELAEHLRELGFDVAFLTFDDDECGYQARRWDGSAWEWTGESPYELCRQHGISISGEPLKLGPPAPYRSVRVRAMTLVEGMRAAEVNALFQGADFPDHVVDGPRGALVTRHEVRAHLPAHYDLRALVSAPIYHVEFDPRDGRFGCLLLHGSKYVWQFDTGDSWINSCGPRVPDVEGETTPRGIVRKLGMPESLVELDPPNRTPESSE